MGPYPENWTWGWKAGAWVWLWLCALSLNCDLNFLRKDKSSLERITSDVVYLLLLFLTVSPWSATGAIFLWWQTQIQGSLHWNVNRWRNCAQWKWRVHDSTNRQADIILQLLSMLCLFFCQQAVQVFILLHTEWWYIAQEFLQSCAKPSISFHWIRSGDYA